MVVAVEGRSTVGAARLATLAGTLAGERGPRYAALAERIRLLVSDGRLPVGVRLPAERELATALGCSRATVTAAYRRLREIGWARARQGAGTWTALPTGSPPGAWVPLPAAPGVVDLAHAAPPAPPEIATAFGAALGELPRYLPDHGYHPGGLPELRARIAERYTRRGLATTPEQIVVTGGALHAITVVLELFVSWGDRVLVEHPSYPNALDAVRAAGAHAVPVALDPDAPDALPGDMARAARQARPGLAYLVPDFQNPTGVHLDDEQRERLAAGLHRPGTVALVDETLAELGIDAPAARPLAAFARPDRAVTVGTMSKAFWGGLRVGWLRASADLAARLAAVAVRSQVSEPVLDQLAACHLLDIADGTLPGYRERLGVQRDALVGALADRLPDWRVPVPGGGLVLWCALPAPMSNALVSAAQRRGLRLAPGPRFGTGHAFADRLRLPYTQPAEVLERAVDVLAAVHAELPRDGDGPAPTALVV